MDFASLQIFKTVVAEGGIIAAARKLHRVQSGVTRRIKQLEASLGVELFVRDKRRLTLSPAGEIFLDYVEQLLRLAEQAHHAVRGDTPRGVLRIGTLESTAASRLPPLLSHYHEKYPAVRVELATNTTLLWSHITPLGSPVLPEVYTRHAKSRSMVSIRGRTAGKLS